MKQVLPRFSEQDGSAAAARGRRTTVWQSLPAAPKRNSKLESFSGIAQLPHSMERQLTFAQRRHLKEQQDLDTDSDACEGLSQSASGGSKIFNFSPSSAPSSKGSKRFNRSRFFRSRRRMGGECCARRGCTCSAPDPYTVSPGDVDDTVGVKEKMDDAASENQLRLPCSATTSTSSWRSRSSWKSILGAQSELSWTKLHARVVGSHVPMPPNSPPEHSPRRRRLAHQAVQSFLSKNERETELAEQARKNSLATVAEAADALDDASPRGSFFKKRASMMPNLAAMATQDGNMHGRASLTRRTLIDAVESLESEATIRMGKSEMRKIAHKRIQRMQDKLTTKRQGGMLQRRYENLPHGEKEFLEKVFVRFDADCSGTLDWDEVTACLREIGLAGTNTLEKREVQRVCRDALKVAQVQHSEVMAQRQSSAQARLRQHRQGRILRQDERRKWKLAQKGPSSVNRTTAFVSKSVAYEDLAKAKEAHTSSKFDVFSSILDQRGSEDSSVKDQVILRVSKDIGSQDKEETQNDDGEASTTIFSKQASPMQDDLCDSEGARSGSENHDADAENDNDFNSEGFSFDFFSFAVLVVPRVRQLLRGLQSSKLVRYFCHFDRDGAGTLPLPKCEEICRCLGLDPRIFRDVLDANKSKNSPSLDFAAFEKSVMTCRELTERAMRLREHAVLDESGISNALFEIFRNDIVHLYEVFKAGSHLDENEEERVITALSAFNSLRTLGFVPRSYWEREHLQSLLSRTHRDDQGFSDSDAESEASLHLADHPELNFEQFLMYLQRVRSFYKARQVDELRHVFDRFDKDRSNTLDVAEVSALLEELHILPRSREEQEEIGQLIQSVDEDGNGLLDFTEFQELVHRIEEKFASMRYEAEIEYGLARGFDDVQVSEFRTMFDLIDVDGSGFLESKEVRQGLNAMNRPVSSEVFEGAWQVLDADESGSLDFLEFIDLMKMLRDGVGMFAEDAAKLPTQICLLDDRVLRVLLGQFKFSSSDLRFLDKKELVELTCTSFGITADENFCERLNVHTLADLFDYVRAQHDNDTT